ncbi:adenylyl-sulfate kinase [Sphingobacteriales bacterium UPWRP_1]|nr:adenylyl-sulfate kinase [Sphingobacteriales bacterium TSM_CSS]PSJ71916.1 adenylyl-sulfate kinase [Sphingobacteriales bacterium UPWRP_1]
MKNTPQNIHPIFEHLLQRTDKEKLLQQHGVALWLTGLSGSGKSTLARGLEQRLYEQGILTQVLDGDNVRTGINNNLGFSDTDRTENIRRIAEVAKLFVQCGIVTICSFVSPTIAIRQLAQQIIAPQDFLEVYINAPLEVCEARDVKGLYKKARAGAIPDFTGITSPFEPPTAPHLEIQTNLQTPEQSVQLLFDFLLPHISYRS